MFCPSCGKAVVDNSRYCAHCGASVTPSGGGGGAAATPPPASPPPAPPAASTASAAASAPAAPRELTATPPGLIERVKNIVLSPSTEWEKVATEKGSTASLYTGYIMPLAAIGPIAGFIGMSLLGVGLGVFGHIRTPVVWGLTGMLTQYVLSLVGVFLVALLVNALAPSFGGEKDSFASLKVTAYSYTAAWLAGIFHLIPLLGILGLIAALYSLYVLYLGLPVMMRCPKDKALGYTAVVVICAIVISIVIGVLVGALSFGRYGMMGGFGHMGSRYETPEQSSERAAGALSKLLGGKSEEDAKRMNDALQKLNALGEQAKQSEEAVKSGAPAAAPAPADVAQAMGAVGQVLAGGKNIEPVDFHELKALLPDNLGGLSRVAASGERGEGMGFKASHAKGHYGQGNSTIDLEITDLGSASGLASLAASFNPNVAKEDDNGYERTSTINGQLVHEQFNRRSRNGSVTVVVGNRFSVEMKGHNVEMDALKGGLAQVDLAKLAAIAGK